MNKSAISTGIEEAEVSKMTHQEQCRWLVEKISLFTEQSLLEIDTSEPLTEEEERDIAQWRKTLYED